jgi:hypothetical protein
MPMSIRIRLFLLFFAPQRLRAMQNPSVVSESVKKGYGVVLWWWGV